MDYQTNDGLMFLNDFYVFNETSIEIFFYNTAVTTVTRWSVWYCKKYCKEFMFFTHAGILVLPQNYSGFLIKIKQEINWQ